MSELKPCPFCGEIPYESKKSGCVGCDSACWFSGTAMNPNDWNDRPIEDALQARIADLEQQLAAALERGKKLETCLAKFVTYDPDSAIAHSPYTDQFGLFSAIEEGRRILKESAAQPTATECDFCNDKTECLNCESLIKVLSSIPGGATVLWEENSIQSDAFSANGESVHEEWSEKRGPIRAAEILRDRIIAGSRKCYGCESCDCRTSAPKCDAGDGAGMEAGK